MILWPSRSAIPRRLLVLLLVGGWLMLLPGGLFAQQEGQDPLEAAAQMLEDAAEEIERIDDEVTEQLEQIEERAVERWRRSENKVAIGSSIKVDEGEVSSGVVAIFGQIKVDGQVRGDAVAVLGGAKVNGRVTGDVVAIGGGVELGPDAEILGSVTSVGGRIEREDGAEILGDVNEVAFADWDWDRDWGDVDWNWEWDDGWRSSPLSGFGSVFGFAWNVFLTFLLLLAVCFIYLVAPHATQRVGYAARHEFFKSGLVGLAIQVFFLPGMLFLTILLVISIIGAPLVILLPFAFLGLFLAALVGYAGVACACGTWLRRRFDLTAKGSMLLTAIGVLAIQAIALSADFLDLINAPFFFSAMFGLSGFLVRYVAWTVGLGAVVLTRLGSSGRESGPPLPPVPRLE